MICFSADFHDIQLSGRSCIMATTGDDATIV